MNEWEKPEAIEKVLAGSATVLNAIAKLKQSLSKGKKSQEMGNAKLTLLQELSSQVAFHAEIIKTLSETVKLTTENVMVMVESMMVMAKNMKISDEFSIKEAYRLNDIERAIKGKKKKSVRKKIKRPAGNIVVNHRILLVSFDQINCHVNSFATLWNQLPYSERYQGSILLNCLAIST
jgi:hypothetical protein